MKIGAVSELTGLSTHTIRYYEKQGLIVPAQKDASGHRQYRPDDVELLNWISCMKHSGMSLSNIKRYVTASKEGDTALALAMLDTHLTKLQNQQQAITHYIDVTQQKMARLKKALT